MTERLTHTPLYDFMKLFLLPFPNEETALGWFNGFSEVMGVVGGGIRTHLCFHLQNLLM